MNESFVGKSTQHLDMTILKDNACFVIDVLTYPSCRTKQNNIKSNASF